LMGPAHCAMAEKREANRDFFVCTIYGKAVCVYKNIYDLIRKM